MAKLSRLEANKEVRRVLNRHGVDLSYCQYSVSGTEIRLTGQLCKSDSSDFNGHQIESMIQEFARILNGFTIAGNFDNWNFSSHHITRIGEKKGPPQEEPEKEEET